MMTIDVDELKRFVESVEIHEGIAESSPPVDRSSSPREPRTAQGAAVEGSDPSLLPGYQAAVSWGYVFCFLGNVSEQTKSDVETSLLFARLAAKKKFKDCPATADWCKTYINTLLKLGWTSVPIVFTKVRDTSTYESFKHLVIDRASTHLSEDRQTTLGGVLDAINAEANKQAKNILTTTSVEEKLANIQIGFVSESNGSPVLGLDGYDLKADGKITDVFGLRFASHSVEISHAYQEMTLDISLYGMVRDHVCAKLAKTTPRVVRDLIM